VLFHTDAAQTFGKVKIDVRAMRIDMLSAGAHKLGGPKGIGFLYVREGIDIRPIIFGGGQERGKRGGTENVAGAVAFAAALGEMKKVKSGNIKKLRDYLIEEIEKMGGIINGTREQRLYNNVHASFEGIDAGALTAFLSQRGVYVSTGSACDSRKEKEDHVLHAMGLSKSMSEGSIRITLPVDVTKRGCNMLLEILEKGIRVLKR
jgi:cysteine desulfurase